MKIESHAVRAADLHPQLLGAHQEPHALLQLLAAGMAWQLVITGSIGWAGVAEKLPPTHRTKAAYVLGHRLLKLKRPADAQKLFAEAIQLAPPDSSTRRLAQAALNALNKK